MIMLSLRSDFHIVNGNGGYFDPILRENPENARKGVKMTVFGGVPENPQKHQKRNIVFFVFPIFVKFFFFLGSEEAKTQKKHENTRFFKSHRMSPALGIY